MTILALDTTSNLASVAIRKNEANLAIVTLESTTGFGHLIFDAIERCKNEANLPSLAQVDCFAAASGPGSFTGVRIGLTAVKGLAEAFQKPVAGISNLRAWSSFGKNLLRAVILDARRSEVYAAVYDSDLRLVSPEIVGPLDSFLASLDPSQTYETIQPSTQPLAPAVALCASLDGPSKWVDPAILDANYVRRSDAELYWRERD